MLTATQTHHTYDLLPSGEKRNPQQELEHFGLLGGIEPDAVRPPSRSALEIVRYSSLFELRDQWKQFDHAKDAWKLTVVLMLSRNFRGHLEGLIRRKHAGLRLRITCAGGLLPGLTSIGDLAYHSASLGWHLISFHRRPEEAVQGALKPLTWSERCVLFFPAESVVIDERSDSGNDVKWEQRWM